MRVSMGLSVNVHLSKHVCGCRDAYIPARAHVKWGWPVSWLLHCLEGQVGEPSLPMAREAGCWSRVGLSDPSFPQIIKKLIERKQAQIRKVYPGLSCFKEGVRQIPVESVPGIREQGVLAREGACCSGCG